MARVLSSGKPDTMTGRVANNSPIIGPDRRGSAPGKSNANGKARGGLDMLDLREEFRSLAATLSVLNQEEWNNRSKALKRIFFLISAGAARRPNFQAEFDKFLKHPLTQAVGDLRSTIVKEACDVLTLLAEVLRDAFEPLLQHFFRPLLKQATTPMTKVIAECADDCLKSLLKCAQPVNIRQIIDGCQDASNLLIRKRSVGYVRTVLETYDAAVLERVRTDLEYAIKPLLSDAGQDVRAEARLCYHLYASHWREAGERLLYGLEPDVVKWLLRDAGTMPMSMSFRTLTPPAARSTSSRSLSSVTAADRPSSSHEMRHFPGASPVSGGGNSGSPAHQLASRSGPAPALKDGAEDEEPGDSPPLFKSDGAMYIKNSVVICIQNPSSAPPVRKMTRNEAFFKQQQQTLPTMSTEEIFVLPVGGGDSSSSSYGSTSRPRLAHKALPGGSSPSEVDGRELVASPRSRFSGRAEVLTPRSLQRLNLPRELMSTIDAAVSSLQQQQQQQDNGSSGSPSSAPTPRSVASSLASAMTTRLESGANGYAPRGAGVPPLRPASSEAPTPYRSLSFASQQTTSTRAESGLDGWDEHQQEDEEPGSGGSRSRQQSYRSSAAGRPLLADDDAVDEPPAGRHGGSSGSSRRQVPGSAHSSGRSTPERRGSRDHQQQPQQQQRPGSSSGSGLRRLSVSGDTSLASPTSHALTTPSATSAAVGQQPQPSQTGSGVSSIPPPSSSSSSAPADRRALSANGRSRSFDAPHQQQQPGGDAGSPVLASPGMSRKGREGSSPAESPTRRRQPTKEFELVLERPSPPRPPTADTRFVPEFEILDPAARPAPRSPDLSVNGGASDQQHPPHSQRPFRDSRPSAQAAAAEAEQAKQAGEATGAAAHLATSPAARARGKPAQHNEKHEQPRGSGHKKERPRDSDDDSGDSDWSGGRNHRRRQHASERERRQLAGSIAREAIGSAVNELVHSPNPSAAAADGAGAGGAAGYGVGRNEDIDDDGTTTTTARLSRQLEQAQLLANALLRQHQLHETAPFEGFEEGNESAFDEPARPVAASAGRQQQQQQQQQPKPSRRLSFDDDSTHHSGGGGGGSSKNPTVAPAAVGGSSGRNGNNSNGNGNKGKTKTAAGALRSSGETDADEGGGYTPSRPQPARKWVDDEGPSAATKSQKEQRQQQQEEEEPAVLERAAALLYRKIMDGIEAALARHDLQLPHDLLLPSSGSTAKPSSAKAAKASATPPEHPAAAAAPTRSTAEAAAAAPPPATGLNDAAAAADSRHPQQQQQPQQQPEAPGPAAAARNAAGPLGGSDRYFLRTGRRQPPPGAAAEQVQPEASPSAVEESASQQRPHQQQQQERDEVEPDDTGQPLEDGGAAHPQQPAAVASSEEAAAEPQSSGAAAPSPSASTPRSAAAKGVSSAPHERALSSPRPLRHPQLRSSASFSASESESDLDSVALAAQSAGSVRPPLVPVPRLDLPYGSPGRRNIEPAVVGSPRSSEPLSRPPVAPLRDPLLLRQPTPPSAGRIAGPPTAAALAPPAAAPAAAATTTGPAAAVDQQQQRQQHQPPVAKPPTPGGGPRAPAGAVAASDVITRRYRGGASRQTGSAQASGDESSAAAASAAVASPQQAPATQQQQPSSSSSALAAPSSSDSFASSAAAPDGENVAADVVNSAAATATAPPPLTRVGEAWAEPVVPPPAVPDPAIAAQAGVPSPDLHAQRAQQDASEDLNQPPPEPHQQQEGELSAVPVAAAQPVAAAAAAAAPVVATPRSARGTPRMRQAPAAAAAAAPGEGRTGSPRLAPVATSPRVPTGKEYESEDVSGLDEFASTVPVVSVADDSKEALRQQQPLSARGQHDSAAHVTQLSPAAAALTGEAVPTGAGVEGAVEEPPQDTRDSSAPRRPLSYFSDETGRFEPLDPAAAAALPSADSNATGAFAPGTPTPLPPSAAHFAGGAAAPRATDEPGVLPAAADIAASVDDASRDTAFNASSSVELPRPHADVAQPVLAAAPATQDAAAIELTAPPGTSDTTAHHQAAVDAVVAAAAGHLLQQPQSSPPPAPPADSSSVDVAADAVTVAAAAAVPAPEPVESAPAAAPAPGSARSHAVPRSGYEYIPGTGLLAPIASQIHPPSSDLLPEFIETRGHAVVEIAPTSVKQPHTHAVVLRCRFNTHTRIISLGNLMLRREDENPQDGATEKSTAMWFDMVMDVTCLFTILVICCIVDPIVRRRSG